MVYLKSKSRHSYSGISTEIMVIFVAKTTAQQKKAPAAASVTAAASGPAASSHDGRPSEEDTPQPREAVGSRDRRPSDKVAAQRMFFYYSH